MFLLYHFGDFCAKVFAKRPHNYHYFSANLVGHAVSPFEATLEMGMRVAESPIFHRKGSFDKHQPLVGSECQRTMMICDSFERLE